MFIVKANDKEEYHDREKEKSTSLETGIANLKYGLIKHQSRLSYEPDNFKRFCEDCNAEEAYSMVLNAMTSARHSTERKELNKRRTVAILNMMAFALSQKCNVFQHDHGQLLLRSGLSGSVLNSERVLGTSMCEREYQMIKTKDSLDHHKIVNKWIESAIEEKRLIVLNIDDYTNVHTKKRPVQGTSKSSKMCTILIKKYELPAVEVDDTRQVNNPTGVLIDDLVSNMSSNEQVTDLCFSTFITACQGNAPWITNRFFDPEFEQDRLTTHDYAVDMAIKKMRKMDDIMLIDCIELPLHSESDFRTAIEVVMKTKLKDYCEMFILPQPGDWPAQFYPRRVVHSTTNATIKSSLVPLLGPLHVSLNGQENVFKVFFELLLNIYRSIFGRNKPLAMEKCMPWRIALILELCYGGWSLIRESILSVFGNQCKDLQFLTLLNFLESYLPLVLTIYAVIFRSNNFQLYLSALKRVWLMFLCFGRHHYDKSPLVFLSSILYWTKIGHPLLSALQNSIVAFTEYPVEYFHSIIRDQTAPHSTADQITKIARSIFASKEGQQNFRQTFLPAKSYILSRNQLKGAKLKAAEVLKGIFGNILSQPNACFSKQPTVGEKREWTLPFLFGNKPKSDKVLPCGFHLSPNSETQPDPYRACDLATCTKEDLNWRVFQGCGHSFHHSCVPASVCPICQDGIRRKVLEHAQKAKEAIFASCKQDNTSTKAGGDEHSVNNGEVGFMSLSDSEIEQQAVELNLEITSWPKYTPGESSRSARPPSAPSASQNKEGPTQKSKFGNDPMHGRRFNHQAEKAVTEFVEQLHGEKPTDVQIKHLLTSDPRLAGESFERVKRKISTLQKKKKRTPEAPTSTSLPVPPWGGHFIYQNQRIEIVNSCPIDNLLTSFHLLFSSDSKFFDAFKQLPYQGAKTLLSVNEMFRNKEWSVGKVIWLTQVKLGIDLTRNPVNVWGGEDERFFAVLREITENEVQATCTNPTCPARSLRFSSKGPITLK